MVATVTRPAVTVNATVKVWGNGNEAMTTGSEPASKRATAVAAPARVRTALSSHPARPTRVPWMGRPLPSSCRWSTPVRSTVRPAAR